MKRVMKRLIKRVVKEKNKFGLNFLISSFIFVSYSLNASISSIPSVPSVSSIESGGIKEVLLQKYLINYSSKEEITKLKAETLKHAGKSVSALIEVMKNGKYPDKNRWVATFLLGQIMGEKSGPFLAKFLRHPNWVMRMASLKTMLALKLKDHGQLYAGLLNDDSLIVRSQALENIRVLKLDQYASQVWGMLYDKKNYYQPKINGKELKTKRANIIKSVILTVGELKFVKAKDPLIKMIQKDKYNDIFTEIDISLASITNLKSPSKDSKSKRVFWQRMGLDTSIL